MRALKVERFQTLDDAPSDLLPSDRYPVQAEMRLAAATAPCGALSAGMSKGMPGAVCAQYLNNHTLPEASMMR